VATITHLQFGQATHRAAQVLRPNREVVAIFAYSDTILYHAVVVGLITADLIPFPISPATSAATVVNLLRNTSCHRLIATYDTVDAHILRVKEELNRLDRDLVLCIEEMPPLAQIYPNPGVEMADCAFEAYPASPNQPEFDDICLYPHSSGSTGFPKAIPETHRALMQWSTLSA
ncbi:amp-CoA ligase, partial [Mycena latifolia]